MNLIKFEMKKNWRRKKFLTLFLLVFVCVSGIFFRNVLMQDELEKNAWLTITSPHHKNVLDLQNELRKETQDNPENELLQAQYDNVVEMAALLNDLRHAIENRQWEKVPQLEANFLDTVEIHLASGGSFDSFAGDKLQQRIEKNIILLKHQLPYEDDNYSLTTTNFMKTAAGIVFSFFGIIILVVIMGDQLSEEFENRTIYTLQTQPLKIGNILISKFIAMMVVALFVCFIFIMTCVVIPFAFGGEFGSFFYPQLVLFNDGFTYISISEYLIKLFVVFLGTVSFAFSLVLLCSSLFKNRFSAFLATLLILLIGWASTNVVATLQNPWNPFYFFGMTELIERPDTLEHFSYVVLLQVYAALILYISFIINKQRISFHLETPDVRPFGKGNTSKASNSLVKILLFEWRKIWRQGYFKQVIIILSLLAAGGYIFLFFQTNQMEKNFIQSTKKAIQHQEQTVIPHDKERLKDQKRLVEEWENKDDLSDEEESRLEAAPRTISTIEKNLEHQQLQTEKYKEMLDAFLTEDWSTYYDYWIYRNQLNKGEIPVPYILERDKTFFTFNASISEKELLSKRQIRPVLPAEYTYTIYEEFIHRLDQIQWKKDTQKIDSTGLFYVYTFFDLWVYIIPLGIFVLLLGAGFSTERGKRRTLNLLKTQPVTKTNLFLGKTLISVGTAFTSVLGLIVFMVLAGTIGNRFGDWDFPVLYYAAQDIGTDRAFHFITMGKYLTETNLLLLTALMFVLVLSLFISLFTGNMVNNFLLTGLLAIGGYFVSSMPTVSAIAPFLPFTYLNVGKIANGELAIVLNNSLIQTWLGIGVLVISSIIFFGIGLVTFNRSRA